MIPKTIGLGSHKRHDFPSSLGLVAANGFRTCPIRKGKTGLKERLSDQWTAIAAMSLTCCYNCHMMTRASHKLVLQPPVYSDANIKRHIFPEISDQPGDPKMRLLECAFSEKRRRRKSSLLIHQLRSRLMAISHRQLSAKAETKRCLSPFVVNWLGTKPPRPRPDPVTEPNLHQSLDSAIVPSSLSPFALYGTIDICVGNLGFL
ncbi:unnamed protein product [Ilex paraguariensis]|uniref:Uncharacterized protein n=1 Tax=Ilex paraguariensis TaxID=185542 RepID=A0ABC8RB50_9AQUA